MYFPPLSSTAILWFLLAVSASPSRVSRVSSPIGVRDVDRIRIPLNIHDKRQYSDDLEVRQEWLKQQGKGLRRKYVDRLNSEGKRQLERDAEDDERELLIKRASGASTCVNALLSSLLMSLRVVVLMIGSSMSVRMRLTRVRSA